MLAELNPRVRRKLLVLDCRVSQGIKVRLILGDVFNVCNEDSRSNVSIVVYIGDVNQTWIILDALYILSLGEEGVN